MIQKNFFKIIFLSLLVVGCTATPPQQPDNICSIFKEKKSWYKAAIRTEKRWKLPPYVLMSFVFQESSFNAKAKPERNKLLGFIPWFRPPLQKAILKPLKRHGKIIKTKQEIDLLEEIIFRIPQIS